MAETPIQLWPAGAPAALGKAPEDIPTLTAYLPTANFNGATMLVLPGGGYTNLAAHEGEGYALWLASHGIAAYVLKYRLGSRGYRHPVMLSDVSRGLRMVRHFARDQQRDVKRVGIMGSSAGGHLAATLLTRFDSGQTDAVDPIEAESSRPDLGVLCYPVISMLEFAHAGSKKALIGEAPSDELAREVSAELHVTKETPPTFLWHTADDAVVPVENSLMFSEALSRNRVPFSLHIFQQGRHGYGLGTLSDPAPPWSDLCLAWLRQQKFLT